MIYLDNNASTKLDPEVRAAMEEAAERYGNPSSVHAEGRKARRLVEEAREEVARLIGAKSEEIFFTSGGTEANAMAIFGATRGKRGRIVRSGAEHPSVREAVDALAASPGVETVVVNPEPSGALDPERLLRAVVPGTILLSVMAANNEYGGVFPIAQLAAAARDRRARFHTDAVQAVGRLPVEVREWGVELLSCSAHKLHGPKGVGALFVRKGVELTPHTPGGGQEKKLRAGTENTIGIVGFGVAARLARERCLREAPGIKALRDRLEAAVLKRVSGTRVVGAGGPRLPNTSAILFEGLSGEALLIRLDLEGIAVSVGSACSSGTLAPSPAILSLGIPASQARSVVRFSLSRLTSSEEVEKVIEILPRIVQEARSVSAAGRAETAVAR